MDEVYEISMLLDFYGELLTARQREAIEHHYNNDLSFGEIAEDMDISRQGVYDNIKRGKATLYKYEDKLRLVKRFIEIKNELQSINNILDEIPTDDCSCAKRNIAQAKTVLLRMINKY